MNTTASISTPLDDLKDLAWLTKERLGFATDSISGRDVVLNEGEEWAFDDLQQQAIEALAKHVPGMRYGSDGLPLYENAEAFRAARTYDDGTPIIERIEFPDVPGYVFTYRPRHDGPRGEFLTWARQQAEKRRAELHAHLAKVGDCDEQIFVEYTGCDSRFLATVMSGDSSTSVSLSGEQVAALGVGIVRILSTQTLTEGQEGVSPVDIAEVVSLMPKLANDLRAEATASWSGPAE
ncbi:hypothetical protein Leucomu_05880 [Leucobacter muris]|uniref:Uncharacterized protein n=1 Tax=Leucobacter muris TaxID=1935379 RepID=A0ABX5QEK3_9MICO|nr:hypothetical protein [Leucobacter muris]QAB17513.1 hypothetical protein Leucomu_05880 [Leucobacter muris]